MNKNKYILLPLSVLALGIITSCNNGGDKASKILNAADATINKVDEFNKVAANQELINKEPIKSPNDKKIYYSEASNEDYCIEQNFGFYIYNNIHYALKYLYGSNNVQPGTIITGKTRRVPDKQLKDLYDNKEDLSDTTLTARVDEPVIEDNKIIINFQADWDFRNKYFETTTNYKFINSAILTNGRIVYNESSKAAEKLMINYYWINDHRAFGSYTMDFLNNKFYFLDGGGISGDDEIARWSWQGDQSATIHNEWNYGLLTTELMCQKYKYGSYAAFTGNIAKNLDDIKMNGYERSHPFEYGKDAQEDETNKEFWVNKVNECYNVNKDLKLRNTTDMLDVSKAVEVSIDNCPKYAEAKTELYWLYEEAGSTYTNNSIVPFIEKSNMITYCDELSKNDALTNAQKTLASNVKNYLNSLKESEYFCKLDTDDFSIDYVTITDKEKLKESAYLGCNRVYSFAYQLKDKKTTDFIHFNVQNNHPVIVE